MSLIAKNDEETIDLAHDYFDKKTFYDNIIWRHKLKKKPLYLIPTGIRPLDRSNTDIGPLSPVIRLNIIPG